MLEVRMEKAGASAPAFLVCHGLHRSQLLQYNITKPAVIFYKLS